MAVSHNELLDEQVTEWLQYLGEEPRNGQDWADWIGDGQLICRVANIIVPGSVARITKSKKPFKKMENISCFIKVCRQIGVPDQDLFAPQGLVQGTEVGIKSFLRCMDVFGIMVQKNCKEFPGPHLGFDPNGGVFKPSSSSGSQRFSKRELGSPKKKMSNVLANQSPSTPKSPQAAIKMPSIKADNSTKSPSPATSSPQATPAPSIEPKIAEARMSANPRPVIPKANHSLFEQAVQATPGDSRLWNNLGAFGGGTIDGVQYTPVECFEKATQLDEKNSKAWHNLGRSEPDPKKAKLFYHKAVIAEPKNAMALNDFGACGGFPPDLSSKRCFEKALEIEPEIADAWSNLGADGGGIVDGISYTTLGCYEKALDLDPSSAEAWNNLGTAGGGKIDDKSYSETECYMQSIKFQPNYGDAWCNLGIVGGAEIDNTTYTPEMCYRKAIGANSEDSHAWTNLGTVLDGEEKTKAFLRALELNPNDTVAWYDLGNSGGGAVHGKKFCVRTCYEKSIELDDTNFAAWFRLAFVGGGSVNSKFFSSKCCYVKALELKDHAPAWNNVGTLIDPAESKIQVKAKDYNSKECFVRALEIENKYADAWFNLASVEGATVNGSDYDKVGALKRVLALAPNDADAWNNLGVAQGGEVGGRVYNIRECFEKALTCLSDHMHAQSNLKLLTSSGTDASQSYASVWMQDPYRSRKLNFEIAGAENLVGATTPWCEVRLVPKKVDDQEPQILSKTQVGQGSNPTWNHEFSVEAKAGDYFTFSLHNSEDEVGLIGQVYFGIGHDVVFSDDFFPVLLATTTDCKLALKVKEMI